MPVHVDWDELQNTFEFASLEEVGSHEAVLCRKTGKFLWLTEQFDGADEWPDDADDEEKYLAIPHKKELDLGKPLVFAFAEEYLPNDFDEIQRIFRKRGAYARFKDLLHRKNALERWYDFENKATEAALREWCEANDIVIKPGADPASEPDQR